MIKKHTVALLALLAGFAPAIAHGGQIGEPAPPLVVKEWIKGEPVEVKAGSNIFVVEIFSLASPASRASLTNLTALQRRFKDRGVVVVGVSDDPPERIKQFVASAGAAFEYAIAADDGRRTSQDYMKPVRQRAVPHAFVVGKDGKLLWHSHPLDGLVEALEDITAGRYNPEQAAKADVARTHVLQYTTLARRSDPRTQAAGRKFLMTWTNDVTALCDLALGIVTDRNLRKPDLALASEALDRATELAPTNSTRLAVTRAVFLFETGRKQEGLAHAKEALAAAQSAEAKASVEACLRSLEARVTAARKQIEQYIILARKDDPKAKLAGRRILEDSARDGTQLSDLALRIVTDPKIAKRDFELADDALKQAERLVPTNSTQVAVSRAVFLFETGKQQEGLAHAKAAVASAQGTKDKTRAEACLANMMALIEADKTNQPSTNRSEKPIVKP